MTNRQLMQKCFRYLSSYADVFSYVCYESSASSLGEYQLKHSKIVL